MFLTEFNLLNREVEMSGPTYHDEILKKLHSQVTDRIAMYENTTNDTIFQGYVMKATRE